MAFVRVRVSPPIRLSSVWSLEESYTDELCHTTSSQDANNSRACTTTIITAFPMNIAAAWACDVGRSEVQDGRFSFRLSVSVLCLSFLINLGHSGWKFNCIFHVIPNQNWNSNARVKSFCDEPLHESANHVIKVAELFFRHEKFPACVQIEHNSC